MIVLIVVVMVQSYENETGRDETTDDVRVWEALYCHGPIVDQQEVINVQLVLFDIILRPLFFFKASHFEFAVIKIDEGIFITLRVLLYLTDLDIVLSLSSNLLFECELVSFQVKHLYDILPFTYFANQDSPCRIIRNHARV